MKPSSKTALVLAALACALSQAYLIGQVHHLRPNLVELQLTFSPGRYWEILDLWGEAGRQAYRDHFAYDFFHIGIFSAFGYLLASRGGLFGPAEQRLARWAAWLLPAAGLFDLGENLLQLTLLSGPPGADSIAIPLSALCSGAKWGLVGVFVWITARRLLIGPGSTSH
ncbi:MAG: hypothetical protein PHI64_04775 [Zoogloea sp.]|uniref:hypothetical protein n=1 Tax=Zoogloea sp. TaxID=49181 RepID=UPI00260396CA|nr:hypothetical protein [Zoogloea sp.]MDD2988256.1 hypothetical protein [Zoogloea sp.]